MWRLAISHDFAMWWDFCLSHHVVSFHHMWWLAISCDFAMWRDFCLSHQMESLYWENVNHTLGLSSGPQVFLDDIKPSLLPLYIAYYLVWERVRRYVTQADLCSGLCCCFFYVYGLLDSPSNLSFFSWCDIAWNPVDVHCPGGGGSPLDFWYGCLACDLKKRT